MNDRISEAKENFRKRLEKGAFDVEHALGMYARGYCTLPAEGIYNKEALAPLLNTIETCHIYLIGYVPRMTLEDASLESGRLSLDMSVLGKPYRVDFEDIPNGWQLKCEDDMYYFEDVDGNKFWVDSNTIQSKLSQQSGMVDFEVKYIGQAYGQDGSRNALDRLLKHETLQKIALKGVPDGYKLTLLLLSIQPNGQLFTLFNPFAKNKDDDGSRVRAGLDKLFNTSEQERTTLYEASLIRYFSPEFNKEFKDSFPSTNQKVLRDCYEKDFSALIAEISIDELPFRLKSEVVPASYGHIAKHDLHKTEDRKIFFGL